MFNTLLNLATMGAVLTALGCVAVGVVAGPLAGLAVLATVPVGYVVATGWIDDQFDDE